VLAVGMFGVVQHLHLDRVPVDLVFLFARAVEDAAVAARLDFPVDRELEVLEFVVRDDVAARARARERAILHHPAAGEGRLPVVAPARGGRTVKQQPPSVRLLRIRQRVLGGGGGRRRSLWRLRLGFAGTEANDERDELPVWFHAGSPASSRSRACTARRPRSLRVMTRMASSPAMVPMISLQPAPSTARPSACAAPVVVLSTSNGPTPSAETSMVGRNCSRCGRTPGMPSAPAA